MFIHDQFKPHSVYIDQFNCWIRFQVFAKFDDIYIHTSCIEITVIAPDLVQCHTPLQHSFALVHSRWSKTCFLGVSFCSFPLKDNICLLKSKSILPYVKNIIHFFFGLSGVFRATENCIHPHQQFFHAEWFSQVIISAYFESFQFILLKRFSGQKKVSGSLYR